MIDYFHLNMDAEQLLNLSSLGLAHLGDGVYELMVRSWLCLHGKATARNLHRATVGYVAAPAQARRAWSASSPCSPRRRRMCSAGAGTPPPTLCPKGGQPWGQYQTATALEALFGWLYLQGRTDRLNQLFSTMMERGAVSPPNL